MGVRDTNYRTRDVVCFRNREIPLDTKDEMNDDRKYVEFHLDNIDIQGMFFIRIESESFLVECWMYVTIAQTRV